MNIIWIIATNIKDWAERTGHPVIKGMAYRLRGHVS